jgi:phosphatidylserine/phosphatidylglycerophosphate/cardiolipin synthase-like enzyme
VWTGSTNITENGIFRNNNNVIVINSPRVAAMYEREFDEMWNGQFGPTSPSTRDSQQTTINGVPVQVLFGSEDKAMPDLVDLVDGAQQSVRFMAFSFTRDDLGDAMLSRAEAGLNVQGIFEARGSETEFSELPRLFCAGLAVRQDGNPRAMHHKVIIIDGQKVVTGSFNFSNNAEESNDENLVIIADPNLAAQYLQEFERRWAEAVAPTRGEMGC